MKKKYYFWIALAAFVLFFNLSLCWNNWTLEFLPSGIIWCSVCLFISYRRFKEYKEQKAEYDARMKAMESFSKAADKYSDD